MARSSTGPQACYQLVPWKHCQLVPRLAGAYKYCVSSFLPVNANQSEKYGQQWLVQERTKLLVSLEQWLLVQAPLWGEEEGSGNEKGSEKDFGWKEKSRGERDRRGGLHEDPSPSRGAEDAHPAPSECLPHREAGATHLYTAISHAGIFVFSRTPTRDFAVFAILHPTYCIKRRQKILQAREPTGSQELIKSTWMHRVVFSAEWLALIRLNKIFFLLNFVHFFIDLTDQAGQDFFLLNVQCFLFYWFYWSGLTILFTPQFLIYYWFYRFLTNQAGQDFLLLKCSIFYWFYWFK